MTQNINETQIERNIPFSDLPVGARAIVMSIGELIEVEKRPLHTRGLRSLNARKTAGRRGFTFIWPDVLAYVTYTPTAEESAAIQSEFDAAANEALAKLQQRPALARYCGGVAK